METVIFLFRLLLFATMCGLIVFSVYAYQWMEVYSMYWAVEEDIKLHRKYKLLFIGSIISALILFLILIFT